MDLKHLVLLALQVSILGTVFGFGLKTSLDDLLYLVRRPGLLLRSLVAVFVVMPLVAVMLARLFPFPTTAEIALVALSISPMPPLLPNRLVKAGGNASYGLALMAVLAVLSIVFAPAAVVVLGAFYDRPFETSQAAITKIVIVMALLPLAAGMLVRAFAPGVAARIEKPIGLVALVLLALAAIVLLVGVGPAIWALVGHGTVIPILIFLAIGMAVGHLLGGPSREYSPALAVTTACRHPAIAFSIASANYPDQHFGATILLYLILGVLAGIPYTAWLKKHAPAHALA